VQQQEEQLMRFLAERVPITLLLDLVVIPDADEIYATEGGSADWLADVEVGVA
jgi:hypothetical protein